MKKELKRNRTLRSNEIIGPFDFYFAAEKLSSVFVPRRYIGKKVNEYIAILGEGKKIYRQNDVKVVRNMLERVKIAFDRGLKV